MRSIKLAAILFCLLLILGCNSRAPKPADTQPKALSDSASLAEEYRICAGQFYESDQLDSALYWYTRATEYDPDDPRGWHGKASTLSRMRRHDEAQDAFDVALQLKPDYVQAIWHRACDFSANLHREEALADLRRAIQLDSSMKSNAKEDPCFQWLWKDKDFLEVVK